jgi:hypothetical protein
MSSTQPRKQPNKVNPSPLNNDEEVIEEPTVIVPKEQFKYGDVKVTSPGVGRVSITIH